MAAGHPGPSPSDEHDAVRALVDLGDALIGLAAVSVARARRLADNVPLLERSLVALLDVPISLGRNVARQRWFRDLVESGTIQRWQAEDGIRSFSHRAAPGVVDSALSLVDLNDVVRRVDIDVVVEGIDIDAIIARVDLDAILERVDIDAIVSRVDLDAILEGIDVDAIVSRVDLDAILERVDIDAIVSRVDLDAIVDRIDIDAILNRIDVNAVVGRVDIDAIIARIDILGLAEYVVEGIDLPGIIRSSTGSMASEGIREVRRQGIGADERVAHLVDRLLRRTDRTPGSVNHVPVAALPAAAPEGDQPELTSSPDPLDHGGT